ncbi:cytidylyltransferase domain-containing protein [Polaribacter sp. Hel1_85]|uniref:acylneuraminate cytidylyltransferase family protein n=1 Tax=Polaribacter sp. Hel1_85 TaxID=1250005 RepID=UPI00052B7915|nr:acylneuraminate cytidylyltransferase family protein [Polaribacter sp. Hel1_85]KGL63237.1 N-acetylneuraminate cytidylyltransferase [Polaribacter sp. Hel1_85]
MQKNLVIIPVRGGSKRLPKKNSKLLGGIPLFVHSINYAKKNSNICHKIVVSTDCLELKKIALEEGVTVMDRPSSLSGDLTPTKAVLQHVLENEIENFDNVILLQATNPFRGKDLLINAFYKFTNGAYESLMTVSENRQKFGKIEKDKFIPYNYSFGQRSQDLDPLYFENGLLYITKASLIKEGKIIGDNNYPYIENSPLAKIDIDDEEDFELASFYYNKQLK